MLKWARCEQEAEKALAKLQTETEELRTEKADLSRKIVEAEREALRLERQLQLEKEMQVPAHPNLDTALCRMYYLLV